jgi:PAS domain S-box-containing protein
MPERNAPDAAAQALRQLAEARDSEVQICAILENAPFELWVRDAEGRCILQNAAAEKHWGDRIGKRIEESGVPDAVAAVWRANNRRAYAGEVVEGEVEYVCDGQQRVYQQIVAPFRVKGEICGVLGFNIDITERKRVEEQLQASEAKYRSLFESIDEGFCVIEVILDKEGKPVDYRFLEMNPAFQRQTGLVDARGRTMPGLAPAREEHWFATYGRIALTGEPMRFESEAAQLGRWYDAYAWRFGRPEDRRVAVLFKDITERKQAEEALRHLGALNQATLNAIPSHIAVLDAGGRIISVNDAWAEFATDNGADDPKQVGVGANYLEVCQPAAREGDRDAQIALRGIEDVLRRKASSFDHEYPCHSPTEERWFHMTVVPLQDDHGGAVVIHQKITDRKRAEMELNAAKEALEQRVAERTKSLQMLHDIASMANQSQNAEQAIQYCLQRTAMYNDWCFGHVLLPAADDPDVLLPGYAWYAEDPSRFRRFRQATLALRLQRGQGLPGRVFASGKLEWTTDPKQDLIERRAVLAEELGIGTAVALPVLLGEKVVAVLEFFSDQVIQPDGRTADALLGAGFQLGRVIERVEFEEHLLTIAEQIQRRFAQDLHDDLGQELTGLALRIETLADLLESSATAAGDLARTLTATVERIRRKTRALSHGLLPAELEEGRLAEALEKLVAATAGSARVRCTFTCAYPDIVLDSRIALHLYRIAQEALTNAVRHSGAGQIGVTLDEYDRGITLSIRDDGQGMPDAARHSGGMGLRTMRYRAGLIGARLEVGPGSNDGTQVVCQLDTGMRQYVVDE